MKNKEPQESDLDPVVYHVQAALQAIRDLPVRELEREQFYTWIYNLLGAVAELTAEDAYERRKAAPPKPNEGQLLDDLAAVRTERWVWKPKFLVDEEEK